jgi:hypothetical protein
MTSLRVVAWPTFVLSCLLSSVGRGQSGITVTANFDGARWVSPNETIELALSGASAAPTGRLAVFVGKMDVSALVTRTGDKLSYRPRRLPLPSGEQQVTVYLVSPEQQWTEIGSFPLKVLTPTGYEKVELTPRLTLNNKGQVAEGHDPAANAPPRGDFQDLAVNTGFQTVHLRGGWSVRSQANFLGTSNRQEALRFAERQNDAPKFDLSDYLFTVDKRAVTLSLGHQSFGQNRHLVNGFGSRGVNVSARLGRLGELALAALNGSSVVGWTNPFGASQPDHRLLGGSLGLEVVPQRPGLVRIEGSLLDGSLLPRAGFTQGVINNAEESEGGGVRLLASDPSQRLRVEAAYTRSRSDIPEDPTLSQGSPLVGVRRVARNARYVDASYQLLRGANIAGAIPTNLGLTLHHERVDPLYRSVAAPVRADVEQNALELQAGFGPLSLQGGQTRARDNLSHVVSILTTRTQTSTINAALPLSSLVRHGSWLPLVSYGIVRLHQFGEGIPPNSEFAASHVPDQISDNQSVSVQWMGGRWHADYRLNLNEQDNREVGREAADFLNSTHSVTLRLTPVSAVDLQLDIGFEGAENKEQSQTNRTRRIGGTLDWRLTSSTRLATAFTRTANKDDPLTNEQDVTDLRLELSQQLTPVRLSSRAAPGQLFARFSRQTAALLTPGIPSDARSNWFVSTGLTLSVF